VADNRQSRTRMIGLPKKTRDRNNRQENRTVKLKSVLFDLDGTLLDTLDDIADAVNHVLADRGLPTHDREAYRWFIGDGSRMLVTRALPEDRRTDDDVEACLAAFKDQYGRNWHRKTRPYRGIPRLVAMLQAAGTKMAVVSNKPHPFTETCCRHFFPELPFDFVIGQQEGRPVKPNPYPALQAATHLRMPPSDCLFLGDSGVDMETARLAGMFPVGALWGFRWQDELEAAGAAACIQHPRDLLKWMDD
jgi:phosphoglycolate phosphatase